MLELLPFGQSLRPRQQPRALVKHLDGVPDDEITGLNIPTGYPLIYELDGGLKAVRHYYLGDPEEVAAAIRGVARQAGVGWP